MINLFEFLTERIAELEFILETQVVPHRPLTESILQLNKDMLNYLRGVK